jgi:hypothetical protein
MEMETLSDEQAVKKAKVSLETLKRLQSAGLIRTEMGDRRGAGAKRGWPKIQLIRVMLAAKTAKAFNLNIQLVGRIFANEITDLFEHIEAEGFDADDIDLHDKAFSDDTKVTMIDREVVMVESERPRFKVISEKDTKRIISVLVEVGSKKQDVKPYSLKSNIEPRIRHMIENPRTSVSINIDFAYRDSVLEIMREDE